MQHIEEGHLAEVPVLPSLPLASPEHEHAQLEHASEHYRARKP